MKTDHSEIVWLASYPKSGNTWMRFFLTCLLQGPPETSADILDCIPEIGSGSPKKVYEKEGRVIVKTHLLYSDQLPLKDRTVGMIYILRNPLDLALSAFNYHMLQLAEDQTIPQPESVYMRNYINNFINRGGADRTWLDLGYGSWYSHLQSWYGEAARHHPHLFIRYEDMLETPYLVGQTIASFLNLDITETQMKQALEYSSFENMKAMEEREIHLEKETFFNRENSVGGGLQRGKRFMNKGKSNRQHDIPLQLRKNICHAFGAPMKQFGYLPSK